MRNKLFFVLITIILNYWSNPNITTTDDVMKLVLTANVDPNIQNTLGVTAVYKNYMNQVVLWSTDTMDQWNCGP